MKRNKPKMVRTCILFYPEQLDLLKKASLSSSASLSEFVRQKAVDAAQTQLGISTMIKLLETVSPEELQAFREGLFREQKPK